MLYQALWQASTGYVLAGGGAVLVALFVDHRWGEPAAAWHPVVWMGHYLGWAGRRVAPLAADAATAIDVARGAGSVRDSLVFCGGVLAWLVGAAGVLALAMGGGVLVESLAGASHLLVVPLLTGVLLKPLLAWRMLRQEVQAVEMALAESLDAGRARLAWLVSRDVTSLSAVQVRESAIETLAENLNDSVIAPLFWFALLGLPGAALYRFANTADAMWGYRGVREGRVWEWAGKWAAWADDVLSWLPARITAWGLCLGGAADWSSLAREARLTPSPNSGWPMAAMALRLGVRLGKPGGYTLAAWAREASAADTLQAINVAQKSMFPLIFIGFVAIFLVAILFSKAGL